VWGWFMDKLELPECYATNKEGQFTQAPLPFWSWQNPEFYCNKKHIPILIHCSDGSMLKTEDLFYGNGSYRNCSFYMPTNAPVIANSTSP